MNRLTQTLMTGVCFLLLPFGLASAESAALTVPSFPLPLPPPLFGFFGGLVIGEALLMIGGIIGAVAVTGGAATAAFFLRRAASTRQLESKNKASTLNALNALDQKLYGGRQQPIDKLRASLASICERDPRFDPTEFCKMAEALFIKLQAARTKGDLMPMRPFLSDGLWKNLATQLSIDAIHQRRIASQDVAIRESAIVGVELGDDFDAIHVGLVGKLRAVDTIANTPPDRLKLMMDRAPLRDCTETWTFLRRPVPETRKSSLHHQQCPMCAMALPTTGATTCPCGHILNSGGSDWVLAQIVEACDFRIQNDQPIEGFARLQALDPGISRRVLDDRAQLVFWSRLDALAQNQMYAFARFAQPQALAQFSSAEAGLSIGRLLGGRVELVQIVSDIDFERAWFVVRWQQIRRDPTGRNTFDVTNTQLMQLARRNGGVTVTRSGLATGRCATCGAEVSSHGERGCAACGKPLNDDWSFVELLSPESFHSRNKATKHALTHLADRIGTIADPWDRRRALAMMVAVVRANGSVSDRERRLLAMCMERWELEPMLLKAYLAAPLEDISAIQPKSIDEARMLFRALAAAALADGQIDSAEAQLLKMMAKHLKLAPDEDYEIIKSLGPIVRHG
ncbi:MAG: TIM44-like domain-containing protein [Myxococcales bacterium]|jgi:predicted lipid-binding transport protein (Tim44 family)/uncharacterized tellurite resistance protein B-like protein|nr:TIM44-like domain-containing protein [Myxococcales bacterium]